MTREWTVPADHPALAGHFPGTPIIPGVLLLDMALRAIAATSGLALETCTLGSIKFLSPAAPGDTVVFNHQLTDRGTIRFEIVTTGTAALSPRTLARGSVMAEAPR